MPTLAAHVPAGFRSRPARVLPRYCTSLINRTSDLFWETRFNVTTTGGAASPHPDARHYGYLAYHTYFSIFDRLQIGADDVVADLGCGKARPVIAAASYPIKQAIGVEIDPALCAIAAANGAQMRGRQAPLRFVCESAAEFRYDEVTVIVMFHPFGGDTMREMLARVRESLDARPRRLRIAYCNPLFTALLSAKPWLQLYESWQPTTWSRLKFPVHFYRAS
jgi:SAM-dependent methyltransferase